MVLSRKLNFFLTNNNNKQMRDINRFRNGRAQGGGRPHGNNRGVDRYGRRIRDINESRGFGDRGGRYGRPFGSRWPDEGMDDRYGSGDRYFNESRGGVGRYGRPFGPGQGRGFVNEFFNIWAQKEIPPINYGRGDVVEKAYTKYSTEYILKDGDSLSKKYIKNNNLAEKMYSVNMYNFSDSDPGPFVAYITKVFMKNGIYRALVVDGDTAVLAEISLHSDGADIESLNKGAVKTIGGMHIRTVEDLIEFMHDEQSELNIIPIEG